MSGGAAGSLLLFLLASLGVMALAYAATRWLSGWQAGQMRGRRLRTLEGLPLGKDRHLLLVSVGKEVLLLGCTAGEIRLLHRVRDPETLAALLGDPPSGPDTPGGRSNFGSSEGGTAFHRTLGQALARWGHRGEQRDE